MKNKERRPVLNPKSDKIADYMRGVQAACAEVAALYLADILIFKTGIAHQLGEWFVEAGQHDPMVAIGVVAAGLLGITALNAEWISWKFPVARN